MTIELFSTNDQYSEEMRMFAYTATASLFFFSVLDQIHWYAFYPTI